MKVPIVGAIVGLGRDTRSNSATRGVIVYSIEPDEGNAGSRVEVDVGYTLTGMLAQFAPLRPGPGYCKPSDGGLCAKP
jgi:aerobic carbon-monoxide dehydrogenase small subunit